MIFLLASNNSYNLGTPRVTFLSDTPAKWKVFRVIYVVGSPIDYAAIAPILSPGCAYAFNNILFKSLIKLSICISSLIP